MNTRLVQDESSKIFLFKMNISKTILWRVFFFCRYSIIFVIRVRWKKKKKPSEMQSLTAEALIETGEIEIGRSK